MQLVYALKRVLKMNDVCTHVRYMITCNLNMIIHDY